MNQLKESFGLGFPLNRIYRMDTHRSMGWFRRCIEQEQECPLGADIGLTQFQTSPVHIVPVEDDWHSRGPDPSRCCHLGGITSYPLDGGQLDVRRSSSRWPRRGVFLKPQCPRRSNHDQYQKRDHPDQPRDSHRESRSLHGPPLSLSRGSIHPDGQTTTLNMVSKNHRFLWRFVGFRPIATSFTVVVSSTQETMQSSRSEDPSGAANPP